MPNTLWVAIAGIFVMLFMTFWIAMMHEWSYHSPDCLRLRRPVEDAPPPYLYISFHGAPDPLADFCTGLGAVQRFALTGAYIGPATDQLAALVVTLSRSAAWAIAWGEYIRTNVEAMWPGIEIPVSHTLTRDTTGQSGTHSHRGF